MEEKNLRKISIKKLKALLQKTREDNSSSWNTYGSELCSGSMLKEEETMERIIREKEGRKPKKEEWNDAVKKAKHYLKHNKYPKKSRAVKPKEEVG